MKPRFCAFCESPQFISSPTLQPGTQLIQCSRCGAAFTDPQPSPTDLERQYSETYYGPENVKFLHSFEKLVGLITRWRAQRINELLAPHSRIFEIGCGRGLLLASLAHRGHECHGTERSELAARRARKNVGLKIYTSPLEQCSLEPNYFDLVILWHVLEHMEQPGHCLSYISRVLKPGGLLLVEVPNYSSLQSRLAGKYWFHLDINRHLYHFSKEGLKELLDKSDFELTKQSTFSWDQCPYGALQSLLNLLGLPPELLYRLLKREIQLPWHEKAFQFLLAAALVVPLTGFSIIESLMGKGGVIRAIARNQRK